MIIKIQRPLMTNGDEPMALIYNKDRSIEHMCPYFEVEELFASKDGEELPAKVYHKADIIDTKLVIGRRVEDRNW